MLMAALLATLLLLPLLLTTLLLVGAAALMRALPGALTRALFRLSALMASLTSASRVGALGLALALAKPFTHIALGVFRAGLGGGRPGRVRGLGHCVRPLDNPRLDHDCGSRRAREGISDGR